MGATEQPNLPGTTEEQPNWRRRFDITPEELLRSPAAQRRMAILDERKR
jgi:4-alpha-glucanotransferase